MASARPPSGGGGTPTARLGFDYSALRAAPNVAREAGRAVARELQAALKVIQNEQRLTITQAQQALATVRAQQSQISATVRAESSVRMAAARAEASAQQQAARAAATTIIEEQKRITAQVKSELRERERAARQSQASAGAFGRGAAAFAGAALGGPIGGLAGALAGGSLPIAAGLAVSQGARFAVDASVTATAYDRQSVAAVNLAGSQAKLNDLLAAYSRASGGAVDKATALSNVTRLQAVGFGDNAEEVERFTRAVRGSSIAMGKLQDEISQEVQLAISNQSLRRLDQIGLGITEVNERIEALRSSNQGMTREAAFQEAVLGLLNEKFGALADSAVGAASGVENAKRAWQDFRLTIGQTTEEETNSIAQWFSEILDFSAQVLARFDEIEKRRQEITGSRAPGLGGFIWPGQRAQGPQFNTPAPSWMTRATPNANPSRIPAPFDDDQTAALRRRDEGFADIERESGMARLEATRSYGRQVASVEAQYQKQSLREAEDFARQRANAETKFNLSLLDVAQDSARQRLKWEQDLARSIASAQADSAERIADARKDTAKRIADLDKDFKKDQAKRERDFRDDMLSAAGRLDAVALLELRKDRAKELKERKDSYEESRADLQEQLAERIADENESLAKSIRQQQEANQRRIEEQAENDALRIQEMKDAFEAQKVEQDIERGIMMARRAEDHATQLTEMATAQAERIQQIKDNALAERAQFTEESNKFLEAVSIHNQKWLDAEAAKNATVLRMHQDLLDAQRRALLTPGHPSLADPYVDRALLPGTTPVIAPRSPTGGGNGARSSSINIQPGAIVIYGAVGQDEEVIASTVVRFLENVAGNN